MMLLVPNRLTDRFDSLQGTVFFCPLYCYYTVGNQSLDVVEILGIKAGCR